MNYQEMPKTVKWRIILSVARWATRHGTTKSLLIEMAQWQGKTALMDAALKGKVAEVRELLAAAADPALCNRQGFTALDLARVHFGGAVPPLLRQLLDPWGC